MISAWLLIPAVMVGAGVGILLLAICSASNTRDDNRKWWDDE
jgi:hypothetical protein